MCAYHCVQLLYTMQHRTVLIIFPLIFQTIIIAQSISTGGRWTGTCSYMSDARPAAKQQQWRRPNKGWWNWAKHNSHTSASSLVGHQRHKHGLACGCRRPEQFCCRANTPRTGRELRPTCLDDCRPGPGKKHTRRTGSHINTDLKLCPQHQCKVFHRWSLQSSGQCVVESILYNRLAGQDITVLLKPWFHVKVKLF